MLARLLSGGHKCLLCAAKIAKSLHFRAAQIGGNARHAEDDADLLPQPVCGWLAA
jgi:hypothetical protein